MSQNRRRITSWIPTVIVGVVAVLFSLYAMQSQSELVDVRKERDDLKARLEESVQAAARIQQDAANHAKQANAVLRDAERALEECLKSKRK